MGAPDIRPVAPGKPALEDIPLAHEFGEEIPGKIILCLGRDMIEHLRTADIHPGTRKVREDLTGSRFLLEPPDLVPDIHLGNTIFAGIIDGDEADADHGLLFLVGPVEFKDIEIRDMVATHNEKILPVKIFLGIFHTAGSTEFRCFMNVRDLSTEERSIAKRFLYRGSHVAQGQYHFTESQIREVCDEMLDRGAVDDGDTGFWPFERERAEAGAFPPAHNTHLHARVIGLYGS